MQLIPPALVPAVQAYLASQGQPPGIIDASGNLNAGGLLGAFYNEVEVRTALTPSLVFPIAAGGAPGNPAMQELVSSLQPTIIFRGPAGVVEVAPYGASQGAASWLPLAIGGGIVILGIGWLVFGK